MEYLDLYNEKREKLGKTIVRGEEIPKDSYIMIATVFIKNSKGEFLFQKTSKEKGSVWATTGGHVISGDDSLSTIVREVEEELGYKIDSKRLQLVHSGFGMGRIFDVYYIEDDVDINSLTLQKEEVESVKWLSKEEIRKLTDEGLVRLSNVKLMKECEALGDIYEGNNNKQK